MASEEFRGHLKYKLVLKELMRAITPLNNMLDLRSVVVVEVEAWLHSNEMIDLKRWAYSKVESGWVEAAEGVHIRCLRCSLQTHVRS